MPSIRTAFLLLSLGAAPALAAQTGQPSAFFDNGPDVLQRAPDFSLPWADATGTGGTEWFSLSGNRGKVVVLAFYPRDFTSTCTAEMQTFAAQYDSLFGHDVVVVGINNDSLSTHTRFAASTRIPFKLLTDADQAVARKYGSADKDGYNRRTIYVIGRNGDVAWREPQFRALDPKAYKRLKKAVALAVSGK